MNRRTLLGTAAAALAVPARAEDGFARFRRAWPQTDFTKAEVPADEILSGGVPKDAIPALDGADFVPAGSVDIPDREPVQTLLVGEVERAYPLRYLTWHEIVNDTVDGRPVAVTFCPLCNAGLAFERRAAGQTLSFGVSGLLRHSDLIMYDRQTESWWQQFTGTAIVGDLAGTRLTPLVSWLEPLSAFRGRQPDGAVMAEPTGVRRDYGRNPYTGYDSAAQPFLYRGDPPPHGIAPLERVVRVGARAWPLTRLDDTDQIEEAGLRLVRTGTMASALDTARISEGRAVGAVRVFNMATGKDVPHEVVFAFTFHAFHPNGNWMLGPRGG